MENIFEISALIQRNNEDEAVASLYDYRRVK